MESKLYSGLAGTNESMDVCTYACLVRNYVRSYVYTYMDEGMEYIYICIVRIYVGIYVRIQMTRKMIACM